MRLDQYDLDRYQWELLIDRWIFDETIRAMLKRKLLDGITYERLAEEFDVSTKTAQNRIYKGISIMAQHVKDKTHYSKLWRLSPIRPSAADKDTIYVCLFGTRHVFRKGFGYCGAYRSK